MHNAIYPFIISFLLGLMIGFERERNLRKRSWIGGIRTFTLIALLGTAVATLALPYLAVVISVFLFCLILLSYYRATVHKEKNSGGVGITTELAAGIVYILGYFTPSQPQVAIILGIIVLVILFERETLHKISREKITMAEIKAAIVILVIALAILPLLPDRTIDPWHLFNPQKLCLLVLLIALMEFGSYIALRIFGERIGYLFLGFLGGLVSSFALLMQLADASSSREREHFSMMAAALSSLAAILLEIIFIIAIISPNLLIFVTPPFFIMMLMSGVLAFVCSKINKNVRLKLEELPNPLDIYTVLRLATIIFVMYSGVAFVREFVGLKTVQVVTFLSALFSSQSAILADAILYTHAKLTLGEVSTLIYLAVLASFISKYILLALFARNRFGLLLSIFMSIVLLSGISSYALLQHFF